MEDLLGRITLHFGVKKSAVFGVIIFTDRIQQEAVAELLKLLLSSALDQN